MAQSPAQAQPTIAMPKPNKQPETKVWLKPLTNDEKKAQADKSKPGGSGSTKS